MIIELNDGTKYDFYKIKWIKIIEDDIIHIHGNMALRKNYKIVKLFLKQIKNLRAVNIYIKRMRHVFKYQGACPYCDGQDIKEFGVVNYVKRLNVMKAKDRLFNSKRVTYRCDVCEQEIDELKEIDVVVYYD